jgi:hypothetical protein
MCGRELRMDFLQTPDMAGTLSHWQYDTFRVDWDDRSLEPAYATFALDADGKVDRITMKAVSPLAETSGAREQTENYAPIDELEAIATIAHRSAVDSQGGETCPAGVSPEDRAAGCRGVRRSARHARP